MIGAGIYGLYSALVQGLKGQRVLVLEREGEPFKRATYINQARVHQGYHYPRSLGTALKSARYFERFVEDYGFCINTSFEQVYATAVSHSWTNAEEFSSFCRAARIKCRSLSTESYFKRGLCDGAFLVREYTYDAKILASYFMQRLCALPKVELLFSHEVGGLLREGALYIVQTRSGSYSAPLVVSAAYASTNQVLKAAGLSKRFKIKYELCEIILCKAGEALANIGITVMDGPFFSIMPFGKTGLHSLTAVAFTPHSTSHSSDMEGLPYFECQKHSEGLCTPFSLYNCNECKARPLSAYPYMAALARKYLLKEYSFEYVSSLYSMKPILEASEIDDSRPTMIDVYKADATAPTLISVLSGKVNTIYDLDEVLNA